MKYSEWKGAWPVMVEYDEKLYLVMHIIDGLSVGYNNCRIVAAQDGVNFTPNGYFALDLEVIDWFDNNIENSPYSNTNLCNCDFITQILPYGCKCGGK